MRKVYLDTNILLDYGQVRKDFQQAKIICDLGQTGKIRLYASYLSFANMGYILRELPQDERYALMRKLRGLVTVVGCSAEQLDAALARPVGDFEDMLQYRSALAAGCDVIVTNDKRHFGEICDEIPFQSSRDFLLSYFRSEEDNGE